MQMRTRKHIRDIACAADKTDARSNAHKNLQQQKLCVAARKSQQDIPLSQTTASAMGMTRPGPNLSAIDPPGSWIPPCVRKIPVVRKPAAASLNLNSAMKRRHHGSVVGVVGRKSETNHTNRYKTHQLGSRQTGLDLLCCRHKDRLHRVWFYGLTCLQVSKVVGDRARVSEPDLVTQTRQIFQRPPQVPQPERLPNDIGMQRNSCDQWLLFRMESISLEAGR